MELRLVKGDGLITGTVMGPNGPLGNAIVTATTGATTVQTVSLTTGKVGSFTLRGLVTPDTYTVQVTLDNYTPQSATLTLMAGAKLTGVQIALNKASGQISGLVTTLADNKPAADVTVTVSSGGSALTSATATSQTTTNGAGTGATSGNIVTVTQSTGKVGSWTVTGLPIPGSYTVTFSRADLQSQTVAVSLDANGTVSGAAISQGNGITVAMKSATAQLTGTVTQRSSGGSVSKVGEAVVSLSSGTRTYTVSSASLPGDQIGHYTITGIVPGTYTLSVSNAGTSPTTVILTFTAGEDLTYDPVMIPPASISGQITDLSGASVAGLQILLYQSAQYPAQVYKTTTTNNSGVYSFPDVDAPQAYVVEVRSTVSGPLGSQTLVLQASQAELLNITVGTAATGPATNPPSTSLSPTVVTATKASSTTTSATATRTTSSTTCGQAGCP